MDADSPAGNICRYFLIFNRLSMTIFMCWVLAYSLLGLPVHGGETSGSSYRSVQKQIRFKINSPVSPQAVSSDINAENDVSVTLLGGQPGNPVLPYTIKQFLVSADTDLRTIKVDIVQPQWLEMAGEYELPPVPPAATNVKKRLIRDWNSLPESQIINNRNAAVYQADAFYPVDAIEIQSVSSYREYKLVKVKIWQASYNPVRGKLRFLLDSEAGISFEQTGEPQPLTIPSISFRKKLKRLQKNVANPGVFPSLYPEADSKSPKKDHQPEAASLTAVPQLSVDYSHSIPASYVIITTSRIVLGSKNLNAFVQHKIDAGHTVKVVTEGVVEDATHYIAGTGPDSRADNIRRWLKNHYITDGIEYVLLIGQPHPFSYFDTSVPMKMVHPRHNSNDDYTSAPTDMYYAELSHTWDLDGDGFAGEFLDDLAPGGADVFCEVQVGRIPFFGSYDNLDRILQKTIDYQNESGPAPWRKKAMIASAVSNFAPQDNNNDGDIHDDEDFASSDWKTLGGGWAAGMSRAALQNSFEPYTLVEENGIYADGSCYPLLASNAALTLENLLYEWQGHYGFVSWWGHGDDKEVSRYCWETDDTYPLVCNTLQETNWYPLFTNAHCAYLDDSHPSIVVQISCFTGYPENSANLACKLLEQGAVASISGTRVTWYWLGEWTEDHGLTYGDNASYAHHIFQRLSQRDTVGNALNDCRANFDASTGAAWANMVTVNLFGDPEVALLPEDMQTFAGDIDRSGAIDLLDLVKVNDHWLQDIFADDPAAEAVDLDANGLINYFEYLILSHNWMR